VRFRHLHSKIVFWLPEPRNALHSIATSSSTKLPSVSAHVAASVWQHHQLLKAEQPFLLLDAESS